MKRKKNNGKASDELAGAEEVRRYRATLVDMLDQLSWCVGNAPQEMRMPRESIHRLLMASYYLLDVNEGLAETTDTYFIKSAIRELQRGVGPLGLGVDYWAKIGEWRERDLREGCGADFLVIEW
jgi:hypothetical protein